MINYYRYTYARLMPVESMKVHALINENDICMKTEIKILKAFHGDCILIKSFDLDGEPYNILIDGGTSKTFENSLRKELKNIDIIHLLILTHVDSDHIGGFIRFFKSSLFDKVKIEKYWINGPNLFRISSSEKISYSQGKTLEELLLQKNEPSEKWDDQIYFGAPLELKDGINFKILSPTKEILDSLYQKWPDISKEIEKEYEKVNITFDAPSQIGRGELCDLARISFSPSKSIEGDLANSSSIALLLNLIDCSILLLGDSRAEVVEDSLRALKYNEDNPLKADFVKISHHGSKNNTSCKLLDIIDCQHYIISTNGGSTRHSLPDREAIARILFHPKRNIEIKRTIYFNYPLEDIQLRSGKFINGADTQLGNWVYKDNITSLHN